MSEELSESPGGGPHEPAPHEPREEAKAPPAGTRHPSLEKTDCKLGEKLSALSRASAPAEAPAEPPALDEPAARDIALLREELEKKRQDGAALARANEELETEIQALRSDFSLQRSEQAAEIATLKEVVGKARLEVESLQERLTELKTDNKELKSQNLSLQYHLNLWGIPVWSGDDIEEDLGGVSEDGKMFFPALSPLQGGEDPIPVVLRGDLSSVPFPNLLNFLANSKVRGVVTLVTEEVVAKLYVEKTSLKLAGWNNRDADLNLLTLLRESELLPAEICDELEGKDFYDLDLAHYLLTEKEVPAEIVRTGLKEHTRVILSYLFEVHQGAFFFQPGHIPRKKDLQFNLRVTDILLKTAAAADERARVLESFPDL